MRIVKITYDAKTGTETREEVDVPDEVVTPPQITKIDINDVAKLVDFAKKMGWIK
jgi:hypothetical protein